MEKNYLIELTNNLYRLTALFPKKEPLRYKIREVGSDILASFLNSQPAQRTETRSLYDLEVLRGFLEVAKNQNWVSPSQVLNIQAEYSKLAREDAKEAPTVSLSIPARQSFNDSSVNSGQDNRQGKIMEFLKEKGKVQVWQVKQTLPEVSKRTLRRDFESLLKQGLVERMGERNNTYYRPSSREAKTEVS